MQEEYVTAEDRVEGDGKAAGDCRRLCDISSASLMQLLLLVLGGSNKNDAPCQNVQREYFLLWAARSH